MDIVHRTARRKCLAALISAAVVAVCVCIGVTMNLTTLYDVNFDHMGIRTFCMFTVNSNILCGLAMLLLLPYTIDGLRTNRYVLPKWVVDLLFAGVTSVGLTFLISLCVLAPVKGFVLIFTGSRFFLHGVCPILAMLAFCFFISTHVIALRESVYAMIPVMLYAMVYYFMVEILGPKNGGWDDFYGFFTRIPAWISLLSFMPLTFAIASFLRFLHNRGCLRMKREAEALYAQEYAGKDARQVIVSLAEEHRSRGEREEILIPREHIETVIRCTNSPLTTKEACDLYLNTVLSE